MATFFQEPVFRARQRFIAAMIWAGLSAASLFLFFFNPASPANQWFPKCPFRLMTGWQCPGCGATRACYQLLHLHPVAAFKLNPLFVMTLPFIAFAFLSYTRSAVTGKPQRHVFVPANYLWIWIAVLACFWVFRNTPWYPFVS